VVIRCTAPRFVFLSPRTSPFEREEAHLVRMVGNNLRRDPIANVVQQFQAVVQLLLSTFQVGVRTPRRTRSKRALAEQGEKLCSPALQDVSHFCLEAVVVQLLLKAFKRGV
jgi:hypothetical protein